jgi:O-antigen/teichoic acid export membrane protein
VSLPESAPSADAPASFAALARGVSMLSAAEAVRVAVSAALAIYLARRLGVAAFGLWTFALAVTGYPLALVEAGLTWIGTRDVAADPAAARPLVRRIVPVRLALALAGAIVVVVCAFTLTAPGDGRLVVILAGASLLTMALTIDWVFYGLERRSIVAAVNVLRVAVFAAAAFAIVRNASQVWIVPLFQAAGEAAAAAVLWIAFAGIAPRQGRPEGLRYDDERGGRTMDLVRQAAPLTLGQFMRALTLWSAVTILGLRTDAAAVGQFGAAQRLTLLAGGFSTLYFYGYVPLASRAALNGSAAIADLVRRSVRFTALATLPFAIAATLLAGPIVAIVFGPAYAGAAPVLRILAWTIPISVLGGHFRHTLISLKETRLDLIAVAAGAVTTVLLNVVLTARFGLAGGAIAMVVGETVLTAAAIVIVARRVDFH